MPQGRGDPPRGPLSEGQSPVTRPQDPGNPQGSARFQSGDIELENVGHVDC